MSESPVAEGITFGQMTNTDSVSLDSCDGPVQQRAAVESAGGIFNKSKLLNIIKTPLLREQPYRPVERKGTSGGGDRQSA